MISMALTTHNTIMSLPAALFIQLSILCTLMHYSLWCHSLSIHTNKATWTLQAVSKLWVMHWICIKLLLILYWSTLSIWIYRTLCRVYIGLTVLHQHAATTSLILLFCTFSISRLCTVYIYIVFGILDLWELLILVILHNWVVGGLLLCTSWLTWFLWSTSWLSSWIGCRIIYHKTIFRYTLN